MIGTLALGKEKNSTLQYQPVEAQSLQMIEMNSVIGHKHSEFKAQMASSAILMAKEYNTTDLSEVGYKGLIQCLIQCESSGDPNKINPLDTDGFRAYGILQYKDFTFQRICVNKYGLPDELMNPEIQVACAEKMIKDGLIGSWPTCKKGCGY